ncbi:family 2 glycosyl hydrolase [Xylariaceae sp. FL0804]|nr:family 2 glycosyl hydrolase [Xylariaceae sp. FL0804]
MSKTYSDISCERQYLGLGWQFRQSDETEENAWLSVACVPTQVHVDLYANGRIPHPFLDLNELAMRWVGEKSWTYRTYFERPERPERPDWLLNQPPPWTDDSELPTDEPVTTDLVFEGLDTFATVYLNGAKILSSDNMFVSNRVNISSRLEERNCLEIVFESTLLRGRELVKEHSHEHTFHVRQTEASRVPVRSAQYNWGWDWGPIMLTLGPWKPIYIEQYIARIDHVWIHYTLSDDLRKLTGRIGAKVTSPNGGPVTFSLSLSNHQVGEWECSANSAGVAEVAIELEDPRLWYPIRYGEQPLYELSAALGSYHRLKTTTGFRQVELVQEDDEFGKSFFFRVNGIDVFCGGSCWIPADSFLSRVSAEQYFGWIRLVAEGNQNMIRIWGGGIYEHDALFRACDKLGILVWQDFPFACASYPTYPSFLQSVEEEARQNVRRLRSHPSLVIWAGNNEDYQVQERYKLEYDYADKDPQSWLKSTFPARYIYEYLLPKIVEEEGSDAVYHPSSPWGDGKPTYDPTVGDKHQWDIWHGEMRKYQEAPALSARFVSEFGMQALPHVKTTRAMITNPQQRHVGSPTMDFRNKAIDHQRRMVSYIADSFRVCYDLKGYTHLSQVVQAETMKFAYDAWRREWGSRKCGGVLVWQLNDCWPTTSWAVVDYYGTKKPAYYAIRNALKPVVVGISRKFHSWTAGHDNVTLPLKDTLSDLWIASSLRYPLSLTLSARFISVRTGEDVVTPVLLEVVATPNGTKEVWKDYDPYSQYSNIRSPPYDPSELDPFVIHAAIWAVGQVVSSTVSWPQPIKYLDVGVDRGVHVRRVAEGRLGVRAARPVKGLVFDERPELTFSDNYLDLVPGEEREVDVSRNQTAENEALGEIDIGALGYTFVGAGRGNRPV